MKRPPRSLLSLFLRSLALPPPHPPPASRSLACAALQQRGGPQARSEPSPRPHPSLSRRASEPLALKWRPHQQLRGSGTARAAAAVGEGGAARRRTAARAAARRWTRPTARWCASTWRAASTAGRSSQARECWAEEGRCFGGRARAARLPPSPTRRVLPPPQSWRELAAPRASPCPSCAAQCATWSSLPAMGPAWPPR